MAAEKKQEELAKVNFPSVQLKELLDLEGSFPEIRFHLTVLAIPLIIIAQIRALRPLAKPQDVLNMESVNTYIRSIISKSYSVKYVGATIAIRRTLAQFLNEDDDALMLTTWNDLVDNPKGEASTKGTLKSAMASDQRLRRFRRGIMLQFVGSLQSTSIYQFRRISADLDKINSENLLEYLPFRTEDIDIEKAFDIINNLISPNGIVRDFIDDWEYIDKTLLEEKLLIKRRLPVSLELSEIEEDDLNKLPKWKQLAYKQSKNITKKN